MPYERYVAEMIKHTEERFNAVDAQHQAHAQAQAVQEPENQHQHPYHYASQSQLTGPFNVPARSETFFPAPTSHMQDPLAAFTPQYARHPTSSSQYEGYTVLSPPSNPPSQHIIANVSGPNIPNSPAYPSSLQTNPIANTQVPSTSNTETLRPPLPLAAQQTRPYAYGPKMGMNYHIPVSGDISEQYAGMKREDAVVCADAPAWVTPQYVQ
jgi:hypothetical protein